MGTRLRATVAALGLAAVWVGVQMRAPVIGQLPPDAGEEASDAGPSAEDAGPQAEQATDSGLVSQGPADSGTAELQQRVDELQQRGDETDQDLRDLQDKVAGIDDQLAQLEAERARADQSRNFRLSRLDEALTVLDQADVLLIKGTFDAQGLLVQANGMLTEVVGEAQTYATGFELDYVRRAQSSVLEALYALGRRDFYEAMRATEAAYFYAETAYNAARNSRSTGP